MKRNLLIAFLLLFNFVCYAQTSHIKFMGVEMGRTIDQFHAGLVKKGAKVSWMNKYAPVGQRLFEGSFRRNRLYKLNDIPQILFLQK